MWASRVLRSMHTSVGWLHFDGRVCAEALLTITITITITIAITITYTTIITIIAVIVMVNKIAPTIIIWQLFLFIMPIAITITIANIVTHFGLAYFLYTLHQLHPTILLDF